MKKYAFELLKPEFGSTVQPGDILIAGTNFGCGSSHEQAATVLSYNGVCYIIAKSFARIFFRNAFNSGILLLTCNGIQNVCEGGDIVTIDIDGQTVSVNGHSFKVGSVPENLFSIVSNGGLIEDTKKRIANGLGKYCITKLHIGEGICHTIMHEAKYAKPGGNGSGSHHRGIMVQSPVGNQNHSQR